MSNDILNKLVIRKNDTEHDFVFECGAEDAADLVVSDASGKNVAVLKDGHIKTKNFDSSAYCVEILFERGGIEGDGYDAYSIKSYNSRSRTAFFIKTNGATSFIAGFDGYVYQLDDSYSLLSCDMCSDERFLLDENCAYVRYDAFSPFEGKKEFVFFGGTGPKETKRVQLRSVSERLVYRVDENICTTARLKLPPNYTTEGKKVPLIIWDSGDGSFSSWDEEIGCPGYEGRVTGINYLADSGFAVLEIYSWGSYYAVNYPGADSRSAMPIPTHLKTHEKGVEYVLSRYNIDPENIFHVSKSGSGKLALFYALQKPSFNLRGIYAMAPVFDDINFVGWGMPDYRAALYKELNMRGDPDTEGTPAYQYIHGTPVAEGGYNGQGWVPRSDKGKQFVTDNADKFTFIVPGWMNLCGQTIAQKLQDTWDFGEAFWEGYTYNSETGTWSWTDPTKLPASRGEVCYTRDNLVMVGNHIPFMVIMSPTDEQTPYWDALEVVKQLKNGGDDASMYTLETGGHSGPDLSTTGPNAVQNVTTRLGVEYASVSIGWYVTCEDIYARFLK